MDPSEWTATRATRAAIDGTLLQDNPPELAVLSQVPLDGLSQEERSAVFAAQVELQPATTTVIIRTEEVERFLEGVIERPELSTSDAGNNEDEANQDSTSRTAYDLCTEWLIDERKRYVKQPMTKEDYCKMALDRFEGLVEWRFRQAWKSAAEEMPRPDWSKGGRPPMQ